MTKPVPNMYQVNTPRTSFNLRLTKSQRAGLSEIILLLAARSRRRGIRGDPVPFLRGTIAQAVPGFPPAWAHTLASYVATDLGYDSASTLGDGALIDSLIMAMWKDAKASQSEAQKQAQAASEAAVQAQMSQILLRGSLLSELARWLKSNH